MLLGPVVDMAYRQPAQSRLSASRGTLMRFLLSGYFSLSYEARAAFCASLTSVCASVRKLDEFKLAPC